MSNKDTQATWDYHDLTKHSYWSVRTSAHYLDWDNMPSAFKVYPQIEPIRLPRELAQTGVPALEAIRATHIETDEQVTPTLDQLASLLYHCAGVTKKKEHPGGVIFFRAAACAGALYPVEIYVVCGELEGLGAGVYHFSPGEMALRRLREGDHRGALARATASEARIAAAPVILVSTAISWRSSWKYRDRAYRYHFWDNGMILANALAVAAAHALPAHLAIGFIEEDVNRLVGIDGKRELALSLLALGRDDSAAPPDVSPDQISRLSFESLPLSAEQVDYSSIYDMHAASSLAVRDEVAEWREGAFETKTPEASGEILPLASEGELSSRTIEDVIQRRASTRRFARKSISFAELSVILDSSTRGMDADFLQPAGIQLNEIYLIANGVEDVEPGTYFYRREDRALELLKSGDFRDTASYLTLDQPLGGDASATIFYLADLKPLLDRYGNRGYRAAQLEAGIIGGKVYIAAYALGLGATGLTFYDDDVTNFFSPHAAGKSCIFVTSIGVPGKKPLY